LIEQLSVVMLSVPLFQVDAFTSRQFEGNPAAICLIEGAELPVSVMTAIASEMNLSETAFVRPLHAPHETFLTATHFALRWFTPMVEVSLCGHATLATAHVIFSALPESVTQLTFHTLSGELLAERAGDFYSIFLPVADTVPFAEANLDFGNVDLVLKAVIGEAAVKELLYVPSRKRILVRLADDEEKGRETLERLTPNFGTMTSLHDGSLCSSVTVTTKGKV